MTTTVTFSAHLISDYNNDPDFMSLIRDPEFGNIAVSTLWAMHKYVKDKNGAIPSSALGDARVIKMIDSIRHDRDMNKAVLEERLANERLKYEQRITMLEEQVAYERAANGKMTIVQRGRDGEQAVMNMLLDELKYSPYDMIDASELKHESDIHVVNRDTGARIVVEVKNRLSAVNTYDVSKSIQDAKYCKAKYGENLAGYLFLSLRGNKRIPTKGMVRVETVEGITMVWMSIDVDESGIDGARVMISRMVLMMHSMHENGLLSGDHPSKAASDGEEVDDLKERLNVYQKVWNDDMEMLQKVFKMAASMEKEAANMKSELKKGIARRHCVIF